MHTVYTPIYIYTSKIPVVPPRKTTRTHTTLNRMKRRARNQIKHKETVEPVSRSQKAQQCGSWRNAHPISPHTQHVHCYTTHTYTHTHTRHNEHKHSTARVQTRTHKRHKNTYTNKHQDIPLACVMPCLTLRF